MPDAIEWLTPRIADAPESLRQRMLAALAHSDASTGVADQLAHAATECLRQALREPPRRESALDLLVADALMTHACEAAAQHGAVAAFASSWDAVRLGKLLESGAQ